MVFTCTWIQERVKALKSILEGVCNEIMLGLHALSIDDRQESAETQENCKLRIGDPLGGYQPSPPRQHRVLHFVKRSEKMKFTLPKDAFPAVTLSHEHESALIEEADTVVKEIVAANETFIAEGGTLGHPYWKLVRSKEGMKVYRQRKKAINQRGTDSCSPVLQSPSWSKEHEYSRYRTLSSSSVDYGADRQTSLSSSSGVSGDSIMEKMRPHGVALMALHGSMDGALDDCMFGCFAPNDEAWKLRSSHINDRLDDARILATIRGPTRTDPCRFLGVKWFAKEHPVVLTGIVQQRDFLILESSGFTRDSKGERVGYFLMHSVTLRGVPELTHLGIVRGVMSFCYLFRQGGPGKIDVFCRGFFDSRGEMPGRLSVSIAAEAAICCTGVVDCAYVKKLRWLMLHASKRQSGDEEQSTITRCEACDKSFCKFSLTSSGSGAACAICRQVVCSKCSVTKKITMHVSDNGAVQQCSLPFCLSCLLKAKQQSGWEMAIRNLEASSASVGSSPPTPPPRVLSNANQRRDGRSYSAYTGSYARQRGEMTSTSIHSKDLYRSTSEQTTAESHSTNNVTVQAWSPRSAGPKSTRGARFG